MGALFDDVSRIIASSMPRRQAFRLIGGAVGGALAASLGLGSGARAWGMQAGSAPCGVGTFACGNDLCCTLELQTCCGRSQSAKCCPKTSTCCIGSGTNTSCCAVGETCCNGICCSSAAPSCCGTAAKPVCCAKGEICCNQKCCTVGPSKSDPCYKAKC